MKHVFTALIESALRRHLPLRNLPPREIHEAMHYAVLNGGKRFRPILVLSACEAVGGNPRKALLAASAVEFIHSYSLVHDDLPALDNDETRRGMPSCHKKFGEAVAILTGDALLTRAFELLGTYRPSETALQLIQELGEAAGTRGMIGGQVMDILLAPQEEAPLPTDLETMIQTHRKKTGRLIEASAVLGALAGTRSEAPLKRIRRFGQALGLAFQVADDIMDRDGYLRFMNPDEAQQKLNGLITLARKEAGFFASRGRRLVELADFLRNTAQGRVLSHVSMDLKN